MVLEKKYKELKGLLSKSGSGVIAFSGGLDSGFLSKVAVDCLGKKVLAVTACSPTYTRTECASAMRIARDIGIRHEIIQTYEFNNKNFRKNTLERCYWCKRELFLQLKKIAHREGLRYVLDGTNHSDRLDIRPGSRAARSLGVISPLADCRLIKEDVRLLARKLGLTFWNKPSGTCLSSRVPFGEPITRARLMRIARAEDILSEFFGNETLLRARDHGDIVRIEIGKEHWTKLQNSAIYKIITRLKKLGYRYVTLDLEGYIPAGLR
ncbi:MAG: ATP-dependent sacrificial sulfur transferase LarE [Candidatus Omnitrophica bacterium]|nr:ATP-dependent sacrificial sulfur transferase LarE [Candidatus Omnitrophota bacterium]